MATASVFDRPSLWSRIRPYLSGYDGPLAFGVFLLACLGMVTMYSVGFDAGTRGLAQSGARRPSGRGTSWNRSTRSHHSVSRSCEGSR